LDNLHSQEKHTQLCCCPEKPELNERRSIRCMIPVDNRQGNVHPTPELRVQQAKTANEFVFVRKFRLPFDFAAFPLPLVFLNGRPRQSVRLRASQGDLLSRQRLTRTSLFMDSFMIDLPITFCADSPVAAKKMQIRAWKKWQLRVCADGADQK
jgi:hypothetical protein